MTDLPLVLPDHSARGSLHLGSLPITRDRQIHSSSGPFESLLSPYQIENPAKPQLQDFHPIPHILTFLTLPSYNTRLHPSSHLTFLNTVNLITEDDSNEINNQRGRGYPKVVNSPDVDLMGLDLEHSVGRAGLGGGVAAGLGGGVRGVGVAGGGGTSVWSLILDPPLPRMVAWVSLGLFSTTLGCSVERRHRSRDLQTREECEADHLHFYRGSSWFCSAPTLNVCRSQWSVEDWPCSSPSRLSV